MMEQKVLQKLTSKEKVEEAYFKLSNSFDEISKRYIDILQVIHMFSEAY